MLRGRYEETAPVEFKLKATLAACSVDRSLRADSSAVRTCLLSEILDDARSSVPVQL